MNQNSDCFLKTQNYANLNDYVYNLTIIRCHKGK